MKMTAMTIIISASLLFLLAGRPQAQTGYFPLQVGNRWIYNEQWVPSSPKGRSS